MTRQEESSPGQPAIPVDTPEPGRASAGEERGTTPRFEEIFVPASAPPSALREALLSPPLPPPAQAPSAADASGHMPVDEENPLGVVGERLPGGRRGPDAASSFEDLVSQMFVEKDEPHQQLDFEVERRQLWPWVVVAVVVIAVGVTGFMYRARLGNLLGLVSSAPVEVAVEPTPVVAIPTPEVVATPAPVPTEPVAAEPTPAPAATPVPAVVDPASLPAATRIQTARWEPAAGGGFVVLEANGGIVPRRIRHLRLDNPPRELLRISGINTPSEPDSVAVGGPLVARIRLGHHPELSPPELYVVLDLGSTAAGVGEVLSSGNTIRIPVRQP